MHLDDDTVAMVALGDHTLDASERAHISECELCAAELDAVDSLVKAGRASAETEIVAPPASVWQTIHSELGLTDAVADDPLSPSFSLMPEKVSEPVRAAAPSPVLETVIRFEKSNSSDAPASASTAAVDGTELESSGASSALVTPIGSSRGRSGVARWWPMAAAALFVGIVTGIVGTQLWPAAPARVLAEATLEEFPNWQASGSALLTEVNGVRELTVDLEAPSGGLREVWLINPETSGLLSIGLLDGSTGQFTIPAGVDLNSYSVVDISEEPGDGNPGHSGDSIVRGELRTV